MKQVDWKSLILSLAVTCCMSVIFMRLLGKVSAESLDASDFIQMANTIGLAYFGIAGLFLGYKGITDIYGKKKDGETK